MVLIGSRSLMLSVVIAVGIMSTILALGLLGRASLGKRILTFAIVTLVIAGSSKAATFIMGENQFSAFGQRLYNLQSLEARLVVWGNAMRELFASFKVFFFGLGPDVSVRAGYRPAVLKVFDSGGSIEGSLDSTYVYILLDYGIAVLILAAIFFGRILIRLTKTMLREPGGKDILTLWICLVSWGVGAMTQIVSVSKFGFAIVQLLAMGSALTESERRLRRPNGQQLQQAARCGGSEQSFECSIYPKRRFVPTARK
jgi:hypothetical protein